MTEPSAPSPPRVVLLTSPGLMGARIIEAYDRHPGLELVGIGLTNRVFKNTGLVGTIRRVLKRSGWSYFLYSAMESTVAWNRLRAWKLPRALDRAELSVRPITDINDRGTLDWLRDLRPDYVVSFFFNQWIGADLCAIPTRRCVNVHPSLLPALRGPDPIFRALERGLVESGVTLHEVANDIDAGNIVAQAARPFFPERSHFHNLWELVSFGADWSAGLIATGLPASVPQRPQGTLSEQPDYAGFPSTEEVNGLLKKRLKLFEWVEWRESLKYLRNL
jgi:methionyl-tRNA formyltransferase